MKTVLRRAALIILILYAIATAVIFFNILANSNVSQYDNLEDTKLVVVLGAGLDGSEVSERLKLRLDKTYELFYDKDIPIITSGGQGADELVSEAEAMKKYLVDRGISEDRIFLENKSTSTFENLLFSKKIRKDYFDGSSKVTVVTSDYHVFRVKFIAKLLSINVEVIGCKSDKNTMIKNVFREYLATVNIIFSYFNLDYTSHHKVF